MWTVRTGKKRHDQSHRRAHASPDAGADRAAAAHRRLAAVRARGARTSETDGEYCLHRPLTAGIRCAAAMEQFRIDRVFRHLPTRQLAGTFWHRAGARQTHSADARHHQCGGARISRLCRSALAPGRRALPLAVPVSAHGTVRCIPHGRSVQPLCILRNNACSLLRAVAAWLGASQGAGRTALYCNQFGSIQPFFDRCCNALRYCRHAEHGRYRARRLAGGSARPRAAACGCGHPGSGLLHQGGSLAAEFLARPGLWRGRGTGGRSVCRADQSRHLQPAAPVDALVWRRRGQLGLLGRYLAGWRGHGHDGVWRTRHARLPAPDPVGEPCGHSLLGHTAGRPRPGRRRRHRRTAVLSARLDTGSCLPVSAGRPGAPLAQRRRHAGTPRA